MPNQFDTLSGTFLPVAFSNMSRALSVCNISVSRCRADNIAEETDDFLVGRPHLVGINVVTSGLTKLLLDGIKTLRLPSVVSQQNYIHWRDSLCQGSPPWEHLGFLEQTC
jgi:hypothetical protein